MRGAIFPADPLAGVIRRDRLSFREVSARHAQRLGSLQVREIPRRMDISGPAVLEQRAEERHRVFSSMSRISAVVAVSPSLGKMRSMLLAWASGSVSVMASV